MTLSRRAFLAASAALAAHGLRGADPAKALTGSQLYGWGQFYEREGKRLADHLDEVFAALRDAGYDYAEGFLNTSHPEENGRFAGRLRAKGLRPVALYTGGRFHEQGAADQSVAAIAKAARVCAAAGFQVLNCNPDPIGRAKSDAELLVQARSLEALGRELDAAGLRLGIHNHTPEMENNGREFRHNFTATSARHVGFCYDVHWVHRGGVQPADALREFGGRLVSWHLRQSKDGIWTEDLAEGDLDYAWIARYAEEHSLPRLYTVEIALENGTAVTRGAAENHRRSRDFVRRVLRA